MELNDGDWFDLTREVLDATGIDPDGDPAACRWAALRSQAHGLDIVATIIRRDGRWACLHNDARFARSVCASFAHDLDKPGDRATPLPPICGRAKPRNLRILNP